MLQLIEELRTIVPAPIDSFFFTNSGAEAVENAVKIARVATGKPNIIVFSGSFHGRTAATMALTTSKDRISHRLWSVAIGHFCFAVPVCISTWYERRASISVCAGNSLTICLPRKPHRKRLLRF